MLLACFFLTVIGNSFVYVSFFRTYYCTYLENKNEKKRVRNINITYIDRFAPPEAAAADFRLNLLKLCYIFYLQVCSICNALGFVCL